MSLRQTHGAEIDAILARYPHKRSAILAFLYIAQDTYGRLTDAAELVSTLENKLGIKSEETTADGLFTLQRVKCLAACNRAPLLQANLDYYGELSTPEKVDELLTQLRTRIANNDNISISGRNATL